MRIYGAEKQSAGIQTPPYWESAQAGTHRCTGDAGTLSRGLTDATMKYEEILLTVEKEEAQNRISEQVSDVRVKTADGRTEYRTNADILLASLSETELPSGEPGSKLRYRTAVVDSQLSHVRKLTWRITQAVEECSAT